MAMSVFVRQEKITVRIGLQSDPTDPTKTRLRMVGGGMVVLGECFVATIILCSVAFGVSIYFTGCIHFNKRSCSQTYKHSGSFRLINVLFDTCRYIVYK